MPLILIPLIMLAAANTRMHKRQADAAAQEAAIHEKEYQLLLIEHNEREAAKYHSVNHNHVMVRRASLVKP